MEQEDYRIKIKSRPENLAHIRNFFKDVAAKHSICESDASDILISIGEATTNAVEHGCGTDIEILCALISDHLKITVKSEGAFSRGTECAEEDSFRGRGILLMLALMDSVSIDESGGNVTVVMVKKFQRT